MRYSKHSPRSSELFAMFELDSAPDVENGSTPVPEQPRGTIDLNQLPRLIADGQIDSVVNAVCDMHGRLVSK